MAYNLQLEAALDAATAAWPGVSKRRMFGGICYLLNGNMCAGIWRDYLIARVGDRDEALKKRPEVSDMDITGRTMKGWVKVDPPGWQSKRSLAMFLSLAEAYVATLPQKEKR